MNSKPNITAFWAAIIALGLMAVTIFAAGWYGAIQTVDAPKPLTTRQIRAIIRDENSKAVKKVNSHVTSETAPAREIRQQINAVPRIKALADRGGTGRSWEDRINARLAGTPMAGQGRTFLLAAADNGLPPTLSYAIAYHESGGFRATPPGSNNYGGMKYGNSWLRQYGSASGRGPDGTFAYQRFPSKETFIKEHAAYIRRVWGSVSSPYEMDGYAASKSWADKVASQMARV